MKRSLSALIQLLVVSASLASAAVASPPEPLIKAPQVDSPTRVLVVGNSYLYYGDGVHNHVRRMVWAGDPSMEKKLLTSTFKAATIGGAELSHHNIEHLTKPGNIGVKEPFQLVILEGGSGEPLSAARRAKFRQTAIEFNKIIETRGAKTALYLT